MNIGVHMSLSDLWKTILNARIQMFQFFENIIFILSLTLNNNSIHFGLDFFDGAMYFLPDF